MDSDHVPNLAGNKLRYVAKVRGGGDVCVCVCVCVCVAGAGCPVMDSDHVPNLAGNTLRYVAKVWGSSRPRRRPLLYLSAGKET